MIRMLPSAAALALVPSALVAAALPVHAHQRCAFDTHSAVYEPQAARAWMSADEALSRSLSAQARPGTQSGIALISEFMKDPAAVTDARGEWIEITNLLPWRLNIEGWTLTDDSGAVHVIQNGGQGVMCRPGDRLVIGNNGDPSLNGGVFLHYAWSNFSLNNTSDQIVLLDWFGNLVDRVAYTSSAPWPSGPGHAIALGQSAFSVLQNDDGANWCLTTVPMHQSTSDTGSPGRPNECP